MKPTLFLTVGPPGTGKTTAARRIEVEHRALRLTKDEWMKALYGQDNPASASDVIEGRLIHIGLRALELGINVVIDFGLWSRDERSALRQAAADIGAAVVISFFELTIAEQQKPSTSVLRKRRTRPGPCPSRNSPGGLPRSTSLPALGSTTGTRFEHGCRVVPFHWPFPGQPGDPLPDAAQVASGAESTERGPSSASSSRFAATRDNLAPAVRLTPRVSTTPHIGMTSGDR